MKLRNLLSCTLSAVVFSVVAHLFISPIQAQDAWQLKSGHSIEREINPGEKHFYIVTLQTGEFLRLAVNPRNTDAILRLLTPAGLEITKLYTGASYPLSITLFPTIPATITSAGEDRFLSVIAPDSGDYRIEIESSKESATVNSYEIGIRELHTATTRDQKRVSADRAWAMVGFSLVRFAFEKGTENLTEALRLAIEAEDQPFELFLRYHLEVFIALALAKEPEKAMEHLEQALAHSREMKSRRFEAYALSLLAALSNTLFTDSSEANTRLEKALVYGEQLLAFSREAGDRLSESYYLLQLATNNEKLGRVEKVRAYLDQALSIAPEVKKYEARYLSDSALIVGQPLVQFVDLGSLAKRMGWFETALELYEQALTLSREKKKSWAEEYVFGYLQSLFISTKRIEKWPEYLEQQLTIVQAAKKQKNELTVLEHLLEANLKRGRLDKGFANAEQMLFLSRELRDREAEAKALVGYASVQTCCLGGYERAIAYCELALRIYRKDNFPFTQWGEAITLSTMAAAYRKSGQIEKAIAYHEQELALYRKLNHPKGAAQSLLGFAGDYLAMRHYEKALEYLEQYKSLQRENRGATSDLAKVEGDTWRGLERYDKAIELHEQNLRYNREYKRRHDEAEALTALMLDHKAAKRAPLAIFYGKQAINIFQEIRNNLRTLDTETQQSFIKSREAAYRILADLLIEQGRLPEAEQVLRMLKEEEYFDFLRRDTDNAPKGEKATLTPTEDAADKRYRENADKFAELGAERAALLNKPARTPEEEKRLAKLEADLVVAGQTFQKFLDQLSDELKTKDAGKVSQLRESQGLMEDLRELGNGAVALYTIVGEDNYSIVLTTADVQKAYQYPIKAADLNRKVLAFREVLQNPTLDPLPLAQELYKILLAPVARDLRAAKAQILMWSLDGVLRYVPMAALHDGKKYLVESYRHAVFTPASNARLHFAPSKNWRALGLGVTKAHGENIPALPSVADEMQGIIKVDSNSSGILPGTIMLDEQFTQQSMLTGLRERNNVVHIASHFQFQPGNETNSALLLGDGSFLSLAQIKALPNVFSGVELLTLSACNTATGSSGANGKEIEGFAVLAQRQGAKAVIASLWPVADRSTARLMQEFYRLRESGLTKAEAMRQAQGKMLRGELQVENSSIPRSIVHEEDKSPNKPNYQLDLKAPYAHPYYWAPFILIGNWK